MKKLSASIVTFIVLILALITLSTSIVSTYNDEYKLVLQFGKVVKVELNELELILAKNTRFITVKKY